MTHPTITPFLVAAMLSLASAAHAADSSYIGQEKRAIKALSEQEINDYLNGRGMGTSKAAELNHYPGPKHVLDDALKLGLSAEQLAKTQNIYRAMTNDARRLGEAIIQEETTLEALYASQQATVENTARVVNALARLQADFRLAHLNAHLSMRDILLPQQIARYNQLRGYDGTSPQNNEHKHH